MSMVTTSCTVSTHESYRIWRHDAQLQLLSMDLAKAARHPIFEPGPKGQHRQRPDVKARGNTQH